jgi:hypothetical protein
MERGIMALVPIRYSQPTKTRRVPKDPQRRPIIVALFQGYLMPPHSRARINWIAAGAKKKKPTRSNLPSRLITVRPPDLLPFGIEMKRKKMTANPPAGRLM